MVTKSDILHGLRELGLTQGDVLIVHSSLSAFGYVEGGADTVIDALLETVGATGTLILPSFTDIPTYEVSAYDPDNTPVRKNIGVIPETFWRRPDVRRSKHPPRRPWAAKGAKADQLIDIDESCQLDANHVNGLCEVVRDMNGYVLMLGCPMDSNTSIHSAEAAAVSQIDGDQVKAFAEFLESFNDMDQHMLDAGAMKMGKIGDATLRLMRSADLFDVVQQVYVTKYKGTDFKFGHVRDYVPIPDFPTAIEYQHIAKAMTALEDVTRAAFEASEVGLAAESMQTLITQHLQEHGGEFSPGHIKFRLRANDHGQPTDLDRLMEGSSWSMDLSVCVAGHWASLGRCAVFGPLSKQVMAAHEKALARQDEVASAIKPKVSMDQIYRSIPSGIRFAVHRIGREAQMAPFCGDAAPEDMQASDRHGHVFVPGQVICVGLATEAAAGINDMYLVQLDGVRRLSTLPRMIRVLDD